MNEEEEKIIKSLKAKIEFFGKNYYKFIGSQVFNDLRKETKVALNLIEKLKKENEELKYENLNLKEERMIDNSSCKPLNNFYDYYDCIPKDKIRERIDTFFDNLIYVKDKDELKEALKEELLEED